MHKHLPLLGKWHHHSSSSWQASRHQSPAKKAQDNTFMCTHNVCSKVIIVVTCFHAQMQSNACDETTQQTSKQMFSPSASQSSHNTRKSQPERKHMTHSRQKKGVHFLRGEVERFQEKKNKKTKRENEQQQPIVHLSKSAPHLRTSAFISKCLHNTLCWLAFLQLNTNSKQISWVCAVPGFRGEECIVWACEQEQAREG